MEKAAVLLLALALLAGLGGCSIPTIKIEISTAPAITDATTVSTTSAATAVPETTTTTTTTATSITTATTVTTAAATTAATTVKPPETTTTAPPETTTTTTSATTTTAAAEMSIEEMLTSTQWLPLISGNPLVLSENHKYSLGKTNGSWELDETVLTTRGITAQGGSIEQTYDVIGSGGDYCLVRRSRYIKDGSVSYTPFLFEYYPAETIGEKRAASDKYMNDSVSTDLVEFTLKDAALSFYAEGPSTTAGYGSGQFAQYRPMVNTDEVCFPGGKDAFFSAGKGHTLVCLHFVIKNLDRTHLDTDDGFVSFYIKNGASLLIVKGYDLNNRDGSSFLNFTFSPFSVNGSDFYLHDAVNLIVEPGDTVEIKMTGVVYWEAENTSAPFELVISLASSDGEHHLFNYVID